MTDYERTLLAFHQATTAREYRAAKRLAARLPDAEQFVVIDHIIACRRRLEATGVL